MNDEAGSNSLEQMLRYAKDRASEAGCDLSNCQMSQVKHYVLKYLDGAQDWRIAVYTALSQFLYDNDMQQSIERLAKQDFS